MLRFKILSGSTLYLYRIFFVYIEIQDIYKLTAIVTEQVHYLPNSETCIAYLILVEVVVLSDIKWHYFLKHKKNPKYKQTDLLKIQHVNKRPCTDDQGNKK